MMKIKLEYRVLTNNTVKQKRKKKAGKWEVPLLKVRHVAEDEMFRVIRSGMRKAKQWKMMSTKGTFFGVWLHEKTTKIRSFHSTIWLRFTMAHVTHPELKCTFLS